MAALIGGIRFPLRRPSALHDVGEYTPSLADIFRRFQIIHSEEYLRTVCKAGLAVIIGEGFFQISQILPIELQPYAIAPIQP
jgi:hypothetical protein